MRAQGEGPGSASVPVGGLAYYLSPPQSLAEIADDPGHALLYLLFILVSCALFSRFWIEVADMGPETVARQLADQGMTVRGWRGKNAVEVFKRYIPKAAAFGGMCIGALTVVADFMGEGKRTPCDVGRGGRD